jgi:hypothetical protein
VGVGGGGGGANDGGTSGSCSQAAGATSGANPVWLLLGLALLRSRKSR